MIKIPNFQHTLYYVPTKRLKFWTLSIYSYWKNHNVGKVGFLHCQMEWRKREKLLRWDHYQLDSTPLPIPPEGEGKSRLQNHVRYLAQEDRNGPKFRLWLKFTSSLSILILLSIILTSTEHISCQVWHPWMW